MNMFFVPADERHIKKEKSKAREMRHSQWWKRKCDKGICHYCGESFKPKLLTMDHVVPIVRGGKTAKGNVVPCCKECNSKKKHMLPLEWEDYLKKNGTDDGLL